MPNIKYLNSGRDKSKVSPYSEKVLIDLMKSSGIKTITITSTARTALDQARIMYTNLERHGISHQKRLYGVFGDKIIDEYSSLKSKGKSKFEIINGMMLKINAIGPRKVSKHAGNPKKLNVIDIAPSSIGLTVRKKFESFVKKEPRVSQFFTPPKDPAYHLEIPQP